MDRVNLSIAMLPMSEEFGWNSSTQGLVQSSFFWGYLLTQVAGGVWADRMGGKVVLGFGVAWWSLATAMTPVAAKAGLAPLLVCRAAMGIGEGVAMPAMNTLLSRWVPRGERSRSLAFVYSGMFVGSITGLSLSPYLISSYGFSSVFFIFGSLGLLWGAAWYTTGSSTPQEDKRVSAAEREYIERDTPARKRASAIPWGALLSRREVWAIIVCHFCHNWGTFILLTWMPTYYADVLGFDLFESGFYSVLPWISMAIASNAAGYFADTQLIGRGVSVTTTRKIMQSVGFLVSSRATSCHHARVRWCNESVVRVCLPQEPDPALRLASSPGPRRVPEPAVARGFAHGGRVTAGGEPVVRRLQPVWLILKPPGHRAALRGRAPGHVKHRRRPGGRAGHVRRGCHLGRRQLGRGVFHRRGPVPVWDGGVELLFNWRAAVR